MVAAIAFVVLSGGCGIAGARQDDDSFRARALEIQPAPRPERATAALPQVDGRHRTYRLAADSAAFPPGSDTIELYDVLLIFYDAAGAETARVTADRGAYEPSSEAVVARGNVVVRLTEGQRVLRTEELHYVAPEDRVWSQMRTVFERPGLEVVAMRFTSDRAFREISAWGVTGRITLQDRGW